MKHAAIYIRVSSKSQDTRSQEAELNRWADNHDGPTKFYMDKATGTNMDRPGFQSIMGGIARGEISTLVIWRIDRLGRTASGLTALFDELLAANVNLISLKDGMDLSTPAGRLMATVIAGMAQYETEVRGERQRAGIAAAKASGKKWGGSVKGRTCKGTKDKAEAVRQLRVSGQSITAISKVVGLSRPTIYRLLA